MKKRLNFDEAYLESLAYREDNPEDYQRLSDQLDESRSIMEHFDDDALIYAEAQLWENEEYFKPGQPNAIETFDDAIWDMPYLDSERALHFAEKIFDLVKYREEDDPDVPNGIAGTIAIGSMKRLTRIYGDRTIPLWKLAYLSDHGPELCCTIEEQIVDNPDIELSDKFLYEVIYPLARQYEDDFLWEFLNRDKWVNQLKIEATYDQTMPQREGTTCRISDQTQAELDPILDYVMSGVPIPAESILELSKNNGSGLRRILGLITSDLSFQKALSANRDRGIASTHDRYYKLQRLARKLDVAT